MGALPAQYTYDERDRAKLIEHKTAAHVLIDKEDNTYDPASNTHRLSIRATDMFGQVHTASRLLRVEHNSVEKLR